LNSFKSGNRYLMLDDPKQQNGRPGKRRKLVKSGYLVRVVSLLGLASMALMAQVARQADGVPLKNWSTPLYWQPNQSERQASTVLSHSAVPQLQFSTNAVSVDALTFVAITPCRLVDTRGAAAGFIGVTPFNGPFLAAGATLPVPVQSLSQSSTTAPAPCGVIPSIAEAYSFSVTVVPVAGGAVDYVTLWPAGSPQPYVATLNDPQGAIVADAAIVPAGSPDGGISVFNEGPGATNVVIDMNGYFTAPTDLNGNTAVGAGTLSSNTSGTGNTASGAGALQDNSTGESNTATGSGALLSNTTGNLNTASGSGALLANTSGANNTAIGFTALLSNTTGMNNTASGVYALSSNTTGKDNTASGMSALAANNTGNYNTASGAQALQRNTGMQNTATGFSALANNTIGGSNTATGLSALYANTSGGYNTASGIIALQNNTIGYQNTANGYDALGDNTTGMNNTADGVQALASSTTGSNNIAIGEQAAISVTTGSNNIQIGNQGVSTDGVAADSGVIRIGTVGFQTSTLIAGIYGGTPSGTNSPVCVDATGLLGTVGCTTPLLAGPVASSRRFKEQIADMGDSSSKVLQLRPVTFLYKPEYDDGSHSLQYGLIAEEVAKLYPEMVGYDKDGQPSSVKFQSLAPMLLNEVQKQNAQLQNQVQFQQEENRKLEDRLAALETLLSSQTPAAARPADNH
jgi:hypothetical protein